VAGALALGGPLRLRRGDTERALPRTSRTDELVFLGDGLRAVTRRLKAGP
jgi:hypothetical protein